MQIVAVQFRLRVWHMGKVVVASFVDAYNNLVKSVRTYRAQHIQGGPGTGGQLKVQGGSGD